MSNLEIFSMKTITLEKIFIIFCLLNKMTILFIPRTFSYHSSFESYISQFLQAFSIDDIEKYDLYIHKNSKYLFYRSNDYSRVANNCPLPSIVNFSIFFHPGHLYSNAYTLPPPITNFQSFLLIFLSVNSHFHHSP